MKLELAENRWFSELHQAKRGLDNSIAILIKGDNNSGQRNNGDEGKDNKGKTDNESSPSPATDNVVLVSEDDDNPYGQLNHFVSQTELDTGKYPNSTIKRPTFIPESILPSPFPHFRT